MRKVEFSLSIDFGPLGDELRQCGFRITFTIIPLPQGLVGGRIVGMFGYFAKPRNPWSKWDVLFSFLQSVGIVLALWWTPYGHLPPPGYSVACIAIAAAIMSVHINMNDWQKGLWLVLIAAFLAIELRAISKDRWDNEQIQESDRKAALKEFGEIERQQQSGFAGTIGGLSTAISGIQSTIQTADATLIQTSPKAAITVSLSSFTELPKDHRILPGVPYPFNTTIANKGNDVAKVTKKLIEIYAGKPDDLDTQRKLVTQFEETWKKIKAAPKAGTMFIDSPAVYTTYKTFQPDDLTPDKTIYFLIRLEYSDSSGRWDSEDCSAFQIGPGDPPFINYQMGHYCDVFREARYRVRQR